ncbi:MAG: hypothetical protein JST50_19825 [Bacteroidetes bacterium]|jgi:hypothetical protein|nr:hypothetical protein [Bacteroidota bacterium]
METLIIQPKTKKQLAALKVVIKAFKIDYRYEASPYNPEFVEKILQGRDDVIAGNGVKIETKGLWSNL